MAKAYVLFQTAPDVQGKCLEAIEAARNGGKLAKGTNETTKAIERGEAKLVVIAEDVDPEEVVMHLPSICQEKRVPFAYVSEKKSLGTAAGLGVGTAAVAITSGAEGFVKEVAAKLAGEKKAEEKHAGAEGEKTAEKKPPKKPKQVKPK
ncbi:50S ribosomal protein L7Ae [Candidatus Norongarragalina meridionalis]|nr:50S ribosomal protein L7Ae [Candidatus Norongarragalina meridionalis]